MIKSRIMKWLLLLLFVILIAACSLNTKLSSTSLKSLSNSENYSNGKFRNLSDKKQKSFGAVMLKAIKKTVFEKQIDNTPDKPLPLKRLTREQLDDLSNDQLFLIKLGHSTILLKVYGKYWLIDPMFSIRASPFSFAGPKRFQPTPITIDDLPDIEKIFISHNHYDHLDKFTIKQLIAKTEQFLVPLGVDEDLQKWGVDAAKITSFNWWQEYQNKDALMVFTPSQHFSGRSLSDRNNSLWGSWVIKTDKESIFFSGDSGYFSGFKEIGDKYGPFDLTIIETGAYDNNWPDVHMFPKESVKAHIDLRGKTMLPVHNSTFDLAFHPWYEPLELATREAKKYNVSVTTPIVGEIFTVKQKAIENRWWIKSK